MTVSTVKASELKARLSHYLRQVRRGESVLVCDRNRVIARIEPAGETLASDSDEGRHCSSSPDRRQRMTEAGPGGTLTPP